MKKRMVILLLVCCMMLSMMPMAKADCPHSFGNWVGTDVWYEAAFAPAKCKTLVTEYMRVCEICYEAEYNYTFEQLDHIWVYTDSYNFYCARCGVTGAHVK